MALTAIITVVCDDVYNSIDVRQMEGGEIRAEAVQVEGSAAPIHLLPVAIHSSNAECKVACGSGSADDLMPFTNQGGEPAAYFVASAEPANPASDG
jgi:hypothetical protein